MIAARAVECVAFCRMLRSSTKRLATCCSTERSSEGTVEAISTVISWMRGESRPGCDGSAGVSVTTKRAISQPARRANDGMRTLQIAARYRVLSRRGGWRGGGSLGSRRAGRTL